MKKIALAAALVAAVPLAATPALATENIVVAQAEKPTGQGTINSIDAAGKKLNMTHGPVAALKWPGMTMDFNVAPGVDFSALKSGQKVVFTLSRGAGGYVIDSIKPE
ncbi:cation transporter [Rhodoblastus acidophilus]|uniref:Cation transporter n=1 Tax=Rhodoblastus acidophilus TaxID=1074 RepID=A0A6N8DSW8_RHOAC|nr:copper-binding protein [Rhodoblastus acidophilus]MCW2274489.1 Cu/Ag efflux protein CusF [Rhodoblastus acidophilus]MTV32271.1 cation transporter [Rhodoblastus acidophilus]